MFENIGHLEKLKFLEIPRKKDFSSTDHAKFSTKHVSDLKVDLKESVVKLKTKMS